MEPTRPVVFQILPSLVVGGAERLVVHLVEHLSRERFVPCVHLFGVAAGHALRGAGAGVGRAALLSGQGRRGERGRAAPTECAVSAVPPCGRAYAHHGLNYAYPLMLRYRTPARVHTVHSFAQREVGVRVGAWVRMLAFRYRLGGVVPVAVADEVRASIQQLYGYPDPPLIPNGIPTDEYAPDPDIRVQWRQAHGIEPHATVLVHVGRFAPPKNHALLIEAFAQVRADAPLYLLLVGGASWRMPCASRSLRWACRIARALSGHAGGCGGHFAGVGCVRAVVAGGGQPDVGDGGDGGGVARGQHGGRRRARAGAGQA
jgi:glycosyltransferase involved in cell wall biosynthesis